MRCGTVAENSVRELAAARVRVDLCYRSGILRVVCFGLCICMRAWIWHCYQMSEMAGRGICRAETDLRACSYMLERMQPMRQNTQKRHEAEGRTWLAGGDTS